MSQKLLGKDGVQQIYPTASGGTEFFLNMDDPYKQCSGYQEHGQFNISYGRGSSFPFTKKTENGLTFFNTTGTKIKYSSGAKSGRSVRLDVYPDGGKWSNKTKFSWKDNPGYLYTEHGIDNGEFTVFIRPHGDLGTHQAYAAKIGGRDEDDIRSLIEMVLPTSSHSTPQVNVNYEHFPYVNQKPKIIKNPPKLVVEKWYGLKCIHKIAKDRKSGDWELWFDSDPFDNNTGKPKNNWTLSATHHDVGVKEYKNVPLTWKSHKDLCRIDGFASVDFTLISDRQIETSPSPPSSTVPISPTPQPPTSEVALNEIKVVEATASSDDGNKPANAVDNDLSTRWSAKGLLQWIKFDLGSEQDVSRIDFQWYDKPPRTYSVNVTFDVTQAVYNHIADSAKSSLTIDPAAKGKTITVTLVDTSNPGKWISIVEAKVFGKGEEQSESEPKPEPTPVPPEPPAQVTTSETLDAFGIQKVYGDADPPVNNWSFTSVNDPRFYEQKPKVVSGSGKDAWLTYPKLEQGRIEVIPVEGLEDTDIETYHYEKVMKKGYLNKPRNSADGKGDWGDIEVTQAIRNAVPGKGDFESHTEIVRGGFRQTSQKGKCGKDKAVDKACEAMSYHNGVYPPPGTDRAKFEKDTKHGPGYTAKNPEFKGVFSKHGIDQKKGYVHKAIFYRVVNPSCYGGFAMKMESYASTDGLEGKKFVLLGEYLDDGKWGPTRGGPPTAASCGCPNEFPIHSMDVCCPGWRIDFFKSFEFGKLSIRSINPTKKLI